MNRILSVSFLFLSILLFPNTETISSSIVSSAKKVFDCRIQHRRPIKSEIEWFDENWQEIEYNDRTIRLWKYSFLDDRLETGTKMIRMFGIMNKNPSPPIKCHIWVNDSSTDEHIITEAIVTYVYPEFKRDSKFQSILISCPVEGIKTIPSSLSLSVDDCMKLENEIKVIANSSRDIDRSNYSDIVSNPDRNVDMKKNRLAVCVRSLDFDDDISMRLIEWIEMAKILGANRIYLSILSIHPNISTVIDYYVSTGLVSLTNWTLPGYSNVYSTYGRKEKTLKRKTEVLPLIDCMYKSIVRGYDYIVNLDIDEMIVPIQHDDWNGLLNYIESYNFSFDSIGAKRYFFLDKDTTSNDMLIKYVPFNLHMMRHIYKTDQIRTKSIINLDRCLISRSHRCEQCVVDQEVSKCENFDLLPTLAQTNHYRSKCKYVRGMNSCKDPIQDVTIWKYMVQLDENVKNVSNRLNWK